MSRRQASRIRRPDGCGEGRFNKRATRQQGWGSNSPQGHGNKHIPSLSSPPTPASTPTPISTPQAPTVLDLASKQKVFGHVAETREIYYNPDLPNNIEVRERKRGVRCMVRVPGLTVAIVAMLLFSSSHTPHYQTFLYLHWQWRVYWCAQQHSLVCG